MKPKTERMIFIIAGLVLLGAAVSIMLFNFKDNLVFFYSPSELVGKNISENQIVRIGGLVKEGSVIKKDDFSTEFIITDLTADIKVTYKGTLPALFREGQGMVARGVIDSSGILRSDNLLAKHDEKYMPREVADSLKKSGKWKGQ